HRLHLRNGVVNMVVYEYANALFRVVAGSQPFAQALDDAGKRVALDEIKQLFLGLEVVIEPGQRDAAQPGQVAHRSSFVTVAGENLGGAIENPGQTTVKPGIAGWRNYRRACCGSCGHGRCWVRRAQPGYRRVSNVRSNSFLPSMLRHRQTTQSSSFGLEIVGPLWFPGKRNAYIDKSLSKQANCSILKIRSLRVWT